MKNIEITVETLISRKPYMAPEIEVDEYMVEQGFAQSSAEDDEGLGGYTDPDGDETMGGGYLPDA